MLFLQVPQQCGLHTSFLLSSPPAKTNPEPNPRRRSTFLKRIIRNLTKMASKLVLADLVVSHAYHGPSGLRAALHPGVGTGEGSFSSATENETAMTFVWSRTIPSHHLQPLCPYSARF